jgi:hypothetical protein
VADLWWEPNRTFPNWKGVYWANTDLRGSPSLIRDDAIIDFDWGSGSPGQGIPDERFSARWTQSLHFVDGLYRFTVHVDDGVRLWVDDQLILDSWLNGSLRDLSVEHMLAGTGPHSLKVEYYDNIGLARVQLSWTKIDGPTYSDWKGEYFVNTFLSGDPTLIRNDRDIRFDWEERAPAPNLPADNFAVRWTRQRQIEPGWYRFTFRADDGVRFYVDDERLLNEWHQTWGETYVVEVELPWKPKLIVEFYEASGDARAHVEWVRFK